MIFNIIENGKVHVYCKYVDTVHQLEWMPSTLAKRVEVGEEVDVSYVVDVNDRVNPVKSVDVCEGSLYGFDVE